MKLQHIGTSEQVSLPEQGIANVSAKIDTGADGSVIWASSIRIKDGVLVFNLFAPGSALYRAEPVTTTAFRVTKVRNSFGNEEFRYKVRLKLTLGEHTLTRWFSLADRSRNNFPILLGKNFLKNRFVVDVAKRNLHGNNEEATMLVLTASIAETDIFLEKVRASNKQTVNYRADDFGSLLFNIDGDDTNVVNVADDGRDIADYRLTYFKNHHDREFAYAAAEYLHYKGRQFIDNEFLHYMSSSKLSEYMKLQCYGLNVPTTISAKTPILRKRFPELKEKLGLPFVLKEMSSDKGKNNYLIANRKQFDEILNESQPKQIFLAQSYVPNDGFYRIYVFGKEAALAIHRKPTVHENPLKAHLNKPAGSANASLIPLLELAAEAENMAIQAASCLNRQVCGVDILQDKVTKKWYILEANNDPQLRSGSFVSEKSEAFAAYIDKELRA